MKILFVASEVVPFAKTGGLADVAYSLPKAIKKKGHDIRVVMPLYKNIDEKYKKDFKFIKSYGVPMNWRYQYAGIFEYELDGIVYYFIDNESFFKRDGFYGYPDDGERFAYFSKAVLDTICIDIFKPDVIHLNDWHTAPIALLLKDKMYENASIRNAKTIYTIHNLKYQGIFPLDMLCDLYGIDYSYLTPEKIEFNNCLNFSKIGIVYSDVVNTVSKTYANEIMYDFYGEGLQGVLKANEHKLTGIVNGIDEEQYNPKNNSNLFECYDINDFEKNKKRNKTMLQSFLRLKVDPNIPLISMVTRLVDMKGIDLVLAMIDEIMNIPVQFIVLGTGEYRYEQAFREIANRYPDRFSANIYFDNKLSDRIYAGSDIFLMPSNVEPCGIGQMIAMRYGTLPIVRQTGGLYDTVLPYNKFENTGNGFGFMNINAHDMFNVIREAVNVYTNDKNAWIELQKRAMLSDNTWNVSAEEYIKLYKKVCN